MFRSKVHYENFEAHRLRTQGGLLNRNHYHGRLALAKPVKGLDASKML
jgi:hypothetical protein